MFVPEEQGIHRDWIDAGLLQARRDVPAAVHDDRCEVVATGRHRRGLFRDVDDGAGAQRDAVSHDRFLRGVPCAHVRRFRAAPWRRRTDRVGSEQAGTVRNRSFDARQDHAVVGGEAGHEALGTHRSHLASWNVHERDDLPS